MKSSKKAVKKFIGERAFSVVQNEIVDLQKLKAALVTGRNARAVFADLRDDEIRNIVYDICKSEHLLQVRDVTQSEIVELFKKAGYDTVIFDDEKAIADSKKYYANGEWLCTFSNLYGRMRRYHMIVAIKAGIDEIKREEVPTRDGEYGTSVLNIQIEKTGKHFSIKNRYNHTVEACDSTLGNNLDRLEPGLQSAVLNYYNFVSANFEKPSYKGIVTIGGVYMKYDVEIDNIYYGDFVLDAEHGVRFEDKSRYAIDLLDSRVCRRNKPVIMDYKEKEAIYADGTRNAFIAVYSRLIRDGIISQGEVYYDKPCYLRDAKKELLQQSKSMLQDLRKIYGFDFNAEFSVDVVIGSFTALALKKQMFSSDAVLLVADTSDRSQLNLVDMEGMSFSTSGATGNSRHIHSYWRKSDFEATRKNRFAVAFVITQDKALKKPILAKLYDFGKPSLAERLQLYKAQKRKDEASDFCAKNMIDELDKNMSALRQIFADAMLNANNKQFMDLTGAFSFSVGLYPKYITEFKRGIKQKEFSSVASVETTFKRINKDIMETIDKVREIMNKNEGKGV